MSARSFAKPPKQVQTVCECILIMKGYKELNWKTAKGMMSDPNFLRSLMEIDFDSITQGQVKNIRSAWWDGARPPSPGPLRPGRDGEPEAACRRRGGPWPRRWRGSCWRQLLALSCEGGGALVPRQDRGMRGYSAGEGVGEAAATPNGLRTW